MVEEEQCGGLCSDPLRTALVTGWNKAMVHFNHAMCIMLLIFHPLRPVGQAPSLTLPKIHCKLRCQAWPDDKLEGHRLLHGSGNTLVTVHSPHKLPEKNNTERVLICCHIAGIRHPVLVLIGSNEQSPITPIMSLWWAEAEYSRALPGSLFLIYFTYTCSDIPIISCCDTTPNTGRFIQTVHANLHSYHARMGRAGRQRSSLWPKRANTQAKNMLRLNTKNSLKGSSHPQKLMIPHQHSRYTTYSWVADIAGSRQHGTTDELKLEISRRWQPKLLARKTTLTRVGHMCQSVVDGSVSASCLMQH